MSVSSSSAVSSDVHSTRKSYKTSTRDRAKHSEKLAGDRKQGMFVY